MYNEKLTIEPELIETLDNIAVFKEKYRDILYNNTIYFDNYFRGVAIYSAYTKFNRKIVIDVELKENDSISKRRDLETLLDYSVQIKIYKLSDGYRSIKEANYLRELSELNSKYNKGK